MSDKRVLLVVRADIPQDPRRQLEWLEQRVFPREEYPNRKLVYVGISSDLHTLDEPWVYEAFEDFQDVYSKLRGEGFFTNTYREQRHFDFALLMHIRRDRASGMGYGLEERRGERCLLRAMFLAARGNVLFGDWGLPLGTLPDVTREKLLARRKLNQYIYPHVTRRLYENLTANVPFTLVVDHFLTPVYESDPGLPNEHMIAIQRATLGELFSPHQLKLAEWNAWWNMYFASDGYCLVYHRWIHMRFLQMTVVRLYIFIRAWTVSSSWLEILIDACGFAVMAIVYGVLATVGTTVVMFGSLNQDDFVQQFGDGDVVFLGRMIASFVCRYAVLMTMALVFFKIENERPMDRIPVLQKMKGMRRYSIFLPICDVLASLLWKHTQSHVAEFLGLWTLMSLVDLTTIWFFVPFTRNCVAAGSQAVLIAVLLFARFEVDIAARLILEQVLFVSPLFVWGRLQLHPELKRSVVVVPCISALTILVVSFIRYLF